MRFAHNCFRCGLDLTGRRAPPDPHYQLAVVVCPRCTAACVRTKPEAVAVWREASHLFYGWTRLGFQIGLALLFGALTLASARGISDGLSLEGLVTPIEGWFRFARIVATLLATALWLGSCFPHWRQVPLVAAWIAGLALFPIAASIWDAFDNPGSRSWRGMNTGVADVLYQFADDVRIGFEERSRLTVTVVPLALAQGLLSPIGVVLVWFNRALVRRKNRRRRRMLRRAKGGS